MSDEQGGTDDRTEDEPGGEARAEAGDDHEADGNGHEEEHDAEEGEDDHSQGLPPEDLQYPEYVFESGEIDDDGSFDLEADLDREELREWVEDLAGGLASHDVAVESPDGYVTLGVAPEGVSMSFDPDESGAGDFEFTVEMRAKAMFVASDPDGGESNEVRRISSDEVRR